jgi:hypothetical protein
MFPDALNAIMLGPVEIGNMKAYEEQIVAGISK